MRTKSTASPDHSTSPKLKRSQDMTFFRKLKKSKTRHKSSQKRTPTETFVEEREDILFELDHRTEKEKHALDILRYLDEENIHNFGDELRKSRTYFLSQQSAKKMAAIPSNLLSTTNLSKAPGTSPVKVRSQFKLPTISSLKESTYRQSDTSQNIQRHLQNRIASREKSKNFSQITQEESQAPKTLQELSWFFTPRGPQERKETTLAMIGQDTADVIEEEIAEMQATEQNKFSDATFRFSSRVPMKEERVNENNELKSPYRITAREDSQLPSLAYIEQEKKKESIVVSDLVKQASYDREMFLKMLQKHSDDDLQMLKEEIRSSRKQDELFKPIFSPPKTREYRRNKSHTNLKPLLRIPKEEDELKKEPYNLNLQFKRRIEARQAILLPNSQLAAANKEEKITKKLERKHELFEKIKERIAIQKFNIFQPPQAQQFLVQGTHDNIFDSSPASSIAQAVSPISKSKEPQTQAQTQALVQARSKSTIFRGKKLPRQQLSCILTSDKDTTIRDDSRSIEASPLVQGRKIFSLHSINRGVVHPKIIDLKALDASKGMETVENIASKQNSPDNSGRGEKGSPSPPKQFDVQRLSRSRVPKFKGRGLFVANSRKDDGLVC